MNVDSARYPALVRCIHWTSAGLVLLAYLTSESAEEAAGANWHIFAGLLLLLLFPLHLVALRLKKRASSSWPKPTRQAERLAAISIHGALFLFLVVQPVLGVLSLWGMGESLPIPFTAISVPSPLALGSGAGHTLEEMHEAVGTFFYAVIALHVLASLWHQFVQHDATLRRMLW